MRTKSIRSRLLTLLLAGILGPMLIGGVALHYVAQYSLLNQYQEAMVVQARSLANFITVKDGAVLFEAQGAVSLPAIYRVVTTEGRVVAEAGYFGWEEDEPVFRLDTGVRWTEVGLGNDGDGDAVTVSVDVFPESSDLSSANSRRDPLPVFITIAGNREPIERALTAVNTAIVGTGILVMLTTGTLVLWGIHQGLSPLDKLAVQLDKFDPERFIPVASDSTIPRELRPMYVALEGMFRQVRETIERERRFTDSAAHELRTPIAELRTLVDVARKWPDPERMISALDNVDIVVDRMTLLLDALLMLSRNPEEIMNPTEEQAIVHEILETEMNLLSARADAKKIALHTLVSETQEWVLPKGAILMIVQNLLSNAIEYTPAGGKVHAVLMKSGTGFMLSVTNEPVALDAEHLGRLFEPFWRAEQSRSNQEHFGLGLTVVKHVCTTCGLSCKVSLVNKAFTISIGTQPNQSLTLGKESKDDQHGNRL